MINIVTLKLKRSLTAKFSEVRVLSLTFKEHIGEQEIFDVLMKLEKEYGVQILAVNPQLILSHRQILSAIEHGIRSHFYGRKISADLKLEILAYLLVDTRLKGLSSKALASSIDKITLIVISGEDFDENKFKEDIESWKVVTEVKDYDYAGASRNLVDIAKIYRIPQTLDIELTEKYVLEKIALVEVS